MAGGKKKTAAAGSDPASGEPINDDEVVEAKDAQPIAPADIAVPSAPVLIHNRSHPVW